MSKRNNDSYEDFVGLPETSASKSRHWRDELLEDGSIVVRCNGKAVDVLTESEGGWADSDGFVYSESGCCWVGYEFTIRQLEYLVWSDTAYALGLHHVHQGGFFFNGHYPLLGWGVDLLRSRQVTGLLGEGGLKKLAALLECIEVPDDDELEDGPCEPSLYDQADYIPGRGDGARDLFGLLVYPDGGMDFSPELEDVILRRCQVELDEILLPRSDN